MREDETPLTLGELLERLPLALTVTAAPGGLDVAVGEPVILDPADTTPLPPHAVVLAVGVDTEPDLSSLLGRWASETPPTAVIVKRVDTRSAPTSAAAKRSGVAVLTAPDDLPWGRLHAALLSALRVGATAPEMPDVPLGDLFALANAIAAMVGGATTIEDPRSAVLAYSSLGHPIDDARRATILGRQIPEDWMDRLQRTGAMRRLWQSDDVTRIDFPDLPGYRSRLAVTVRAGGEPLGTIWVVEGDQPFDADAERRLRAAADIAAVHLLRHRSSYDAVRQRRAEALMQLLDGTGPDERTSAVLGLDPQQPAVVVGFDVDADEATGVVAASRVADLAAMHFEAYRRRATCATQGNRAYAVVPLVGVQPLTEPVRHLAELVVQRAGSALRLNVVAGIGSLATGLEALAASRREADQVIEVLRLGTRRPSLTVAEIGQVRAQAILRRLAELSRHHPELKEGRLEAMVAQDATKSSEWVPTLRAYFDAFGDMVAAAAAMNIHPNTFRYRVRRIREVFGIDLDDPDERLVTELQLRFLGADDQG